MTVEIDTDTGAYDMVFNNLTDKTKGVDYNLVMKVMYAIFGDFERKTGGDIARGTTEIRGDN